MTFVKRAPSKFAFVKFAPAKFAPVKSAKTNCKPFSPTIVLIPFTECPTLPSMYNSFDKISRRVLAPDTDVVSSDALIQAANNFSIASPSGVPSLPLTRVITLVFITESLFL